MKNAESLKDDAAFVEVCFNHWVLWSVVWQLTVAVRKACSIVLSATAIEHHLSVYPVIETVRPILFSRERHLIVNMDDIAWHSWLSWNMHIIQKLFGCCCITSPFCTLYA